jgi:CRISPR system Cascade subunit CasB
MGGFIEWLESLNGKDTKVRAVLHRSLSFDPGSFPPAFTYVEPFLKDETCPWQRNAFYLVAGLWAAHWRNGRKGKPRPIGKACAEYLRQSKSASVERRFITLLDSDRDQLPHRLRHMIALLTDQTIEFEELLNGLLRWGDERMPVQNEWARDFYRNLDSETTASQR